MKEKIIVDNKKALILTFGILLVIITIFSLSYAYFDDEEDPRQSSTMELTSANLGVEFNDSSEINIDSLVPGQSVSKTFTVNNTGGGSLYYDLIFTNVESTVVGSDFVYTLTSTNGGGTVSETVMPTNFSTLVTGILIPTDTNQIYTLTITYKNNPMEDQSVNMNAYFNGRIELQSPYNSGTNTLIDIHEDFTYIAPTDLASNPYYEYEVPVQGWYEIKTWGAKGGATTSVAGGKGGYTSGKIHLNKNDILYIYVGGAGKTVTSGTTYYAEGGYNGGGYGGSYSSNYSMGGGGATDIRLTPGNWYDETGLNSRIMVAGAGGATTTNSTAIPGYSGGLIGKFGVASSGTYTTSSYYANGGTQISGGVNAYDSSKNGLYGKALQSPSAGWGGGGGGSSFISGYAGVTAIDEGSISEPRAHTNNNTKHYSGKYFVDGVMIPGNQSMPSPTGGTEVGHSGNGHARITYLGSNAPSRVNTKLNNVRYIKDCSNENSVNDQNHWAEVQGIDTSGINRALGKIGRLYNQNGTEVTTPVSSSKDFLLATDGLVDEKYFQGLTSTGYQCFIVDISDEENNIHTYDLNEIAIWHYYEEGRTYYSNTTYVSSDGTNWTSVMATQEPETSQGKRVSAYD